jgi:hypothetical protein
MALQKTAIRLVSRMTARLRARFELMSPERRVHDEPKSPNALKSQRQLLLREIYYSFSKLEKDSPAYLSLAQNGQVWYYFFQPGNIPRYGYDALESVEFQTYGLSAINNIIQENSGLLRKIDELRTSIRIVSITKALVPEFAQQSHAN